MTELAFMAMDRDSENSFTDCTIEFEASHDAVVSRDNPPIMDTIGDHMNNYSEHIENLPGTEVLEICGDTVNPHKKVNAEDFQVMKVIGKGGYGTVFLVQKASDSPDIGKYYAMKVLKKAKLIQNEKNTAHTVSERNVLQMLKHPFLVRLHYAFQNRSNLFIVLEYCPGGELFRYLELECFLMEDAACFFISEIALAIGHLHSLGIIYRDLKPENILLDKDGHVKLTDFGLSKEGACTTNTFCGTIEYMAPEIIRCAGHGKSVDWWSLGTLLFDMLSGGPPFSQEGNKKATAEKILKSNVKFPPSFSAEAMSLIRGLLKKDPKERLGSNEDVEEIKKHSFFIRHDINWEDVYNRKMEPPFKPELSSDSDVSMFDPSFTGMKPIVSPGNTDEPIPIDLFQGFSFVASSVMESPQAIVPDISRLRAGQRTRINPGLIASPGSSLRTNALSPKTVQHESSESPKCFSSASYGGVDLRDFAPLRIIQAPLAQNGEVAANQPAPLNGVRRTSNEEEDNIPGAQDIRFGGPRTPVSFQTNLDVSGRHQPPPAPPNSGRQIKETPHASHTANSKNSKPRLLGDTKPCSYPNLLSTRTNDPAKHPPASLKQAGAGHTSLNNVTTPAVDNENSSRSSSGRAKYQGQHGGPNTQKDTKCSLL